MLRTLDVGLHGLSNPTRSHHCIKNGLEEQEGWVHRMGMVDIWHVFRPFFENGKISFEWQDPQIILQSYIYLSEKLQMICEPSEMAARMTPPPPPHTGMGYIDFMRNLRRSVIFFSYTPRRLRIAVQKEKPSQLTAFPSLPWSLMSRIMNVGVQLLLLFVSNVPWASICLTFWGNRILFYMPPRLQYTLSEFQMS